MLHPLNNICDVANLAAEYHTNNYPPIDWHVEFIGKHIYFGTKVSIDNYDTCRIVFKYQQATRKLRAYINDVYSSEHIKDKDKQRIRKAFYTLLESTDKNSLTTIHTSLPDTLYDILGKKYHNKLFKGD